MENLTFGSWGPILDTSKCTKTLQAMQIRPFLVTNHQFLRPRSARKRYRQSKYGHFWSQKITFCDLEMQENVTGKANTAICGVKKLVNYSYRPVGGSLGCCLCG